MGSGPWPCPKNSESGGGVLRIYAVDLQEFQFECSSRVAAVAWSIWNARNKIIFEDHQLPPAVILSNGLVIVDEFKKVKSSLCP